MQSKTLLYQSFKKELDRITQIGANFYLNLKN
jgi:hypothetical protein